MKLRIGQGYDIHQLADGYEFWLGGIFIPHEYGTVGHSDGDALIHAICDAMFGALSLGDIGTHFPDNDPEYKGVDSKILLRETLHKIKSKGYRVNNIDSTVCLERPKLKPYIPEMIATLSEILNINEDQLSIKATTSEKLGFVGREEGIKAYASVLLIAD